MLGCLFGSLEEITRQTRTCWRDCMIYNIALERLYTCNKCALNGHLEFLCSGQYIYIKTVTVKHMHGQHIHLNWICCTLKYLIRVNRGVHPRQKLHNTKVFNFNCMCDSCRLCTHTFVVAVCV